MLLSEICVTLLENPEKPRTTSTRSSTPMSKISDLEAQPMSLDVHGSFDASSLSHTLVAPPSSGRLERRSRGISHYEHIIRKYREIMDGFQNEIRHRSGPVSHGAGQSSSNSTSDFVKS